MVLLNVLLVVLLSVLLSVLYMLMLVMCISCVWLLDISSVMNGNGGGVLISNGDSRWFLR